MKVETYESGGHKFGISVPETVEEYDALAKKQGACLAAAIDHEVYHGTLGDIRTAFADAIGEHYKSPRREIGTGVFEGEGEDRKEVTKSEPNDVYLKRVAAEHSLVGESPFQHIADMLSHSGAKEVKFDPSYRERKAPQPPKVAKWATEQATQFLATATEKARNKFIAHAKSVANFDVEYTGDNAIDIERFARAAMAVKAATPVFGN